MSTRCAHSWRAWKEYGNPVTVLDVGPTGGVIRLTDPLHLRLYQQTGHLKSQIGVQDYEALFEAIWQDRAQAAGWDLAIVRDDRSIELRFRSKPEPSHEDS
jgi:hypothetical protein